MALILWMFTAFILLMALIIFCMRPIASARQRESATITIKPLTKTQPKEAGQ
jgi:hypothetical protein